MRCESTLPTVIRASNSWFASAIVVLSIGLTNASANASPRSPATNSFATPIIDVAIVGPGDAFYTVFGHTAVVVRDDQAQPLDEAKVYNFGVTKLGDPAFIYNFIMGESVYWGNRRSYGYQRSKWTRNDRTIRRYQLLVAPEIARAIKSDLDKMVKKDSREFVYDLFRVNCVTKIRDLIDSHLGGIMKARWTQNMDPETFRKRSEVGYSNHPLFYVAFQWVLGRKMDLKPDGYLKSGDPIAFESRLKNLETDGGRKLFGAAVFDHQRMGPKPIGNPVRWYPISLSLIMLSALLFVTYRRRLPVPFYGGLFIILGLIFSAFATALLYLHMVSQWPEIRQNLLIFVVWPTDVILCKPGWRMLLGKTETSPFILKYLKLHLIVSISLLGLGFVVSELNGPLLPRLTLTAIWAMLFALMRLGLGDTQKNASEIDSNP
ncbi:MAG: DUF4105 domain-containing protein [Myxococcota bacterium]|nr:DUF4105 domain-containing protein [Myxococcota bacterium]